MNESSVHQGEIGVIEAADDLDCEHPIAAVISDANGNHFCTRCNAEWWEAPL